MFVLLLAFLVLIILVGKYRNDRKRLVTYIEKFNGPPLKPIFGNALGFSSGPTDYFNQFLRWEQEYGSPFRLWLLNTPYVFISDPEDIQMILNKNLEKDKTYKFLAELLGNGLITASLDKWKRSRRIINPAFNVTTLAEYFLDSFNRENEKLIQKLTKKAITGEHFDIGIDIDFSTFSTICKTAMDYTEDEETSFMEVRETHMRAAELLGKRYYSPWLHSAPIFKAYCYINKFTNIYKEVQDLPKKVIQKKRHNLTTNTVSKINSNESKTSRNVLDILLDYRHSNDSFSDEELTQEILTLIFAGSETTSTAISFLLLMLAMKPEIQEKVYQEIKGVTNDDDQPLTASELHKLVYLEQCVKETLRRFNILPFVVRQNHTDITLRKGQIIPTGTSITLFLSAVHLNEKLYPNPYEWNPENFHPDVVNKRPPHTFVPFGNGPRMCLGYKYSYLAIKAQVAAVLRNFVVSTDIKMKDVEPLVWIIFRSGNGYRVRLDRRETS